MPSLTKDLERHPHPSAVRRSVFVIGAVVLLIIAGLGANAIVHPPTHDCVHSSVYGTQCQHISGNGLTVAAVETQFSFIPDFFHGLTWTFETTTYSCDPRGRTKTECAPEQTQYGTARHGNPTNADFACIREPGPLDVPSGQTRSTPCFGNLNFTLPATFTQAGWLCTEIAVRVHGTTWVDNGPAESAGHRSCSRVH
jgi:hypothetical protein